MKRKGYFIILAVSLFIFLGNAEALEVASLMKDGKEVKYEDIDEAILSAQDKDIITLLSDVSPTKTFYKSLTFKGNFTITYNVYGWRYKSDLTLDGSHLVINSKEGMKKADNGEAPTWASMVLGGNLTAINGGSITFSYDSNKGVMNAIYADNKATINVIDNAKFKIEGLNTSGKAGQGIQLDMTAGSGIFVKNNSSFLIDGANRGYVNSPTVYVENSNFTVQNCTANASNGGLFEAKNSKINFLNNVGHGLSTGILKVSNNSVVNATNNAYYGITSTNEITVDDSSTIISNENGYGFIGGGIRLGTSGKLNKSVGNIASGAKVTLKGNKSNALENYGQFKFAENVSLEITENKDKSNGAGIFNAGTLTLPSKAIVQNNHADNYGGGIYNKGIVNAINSALYNNHAGKAGDDIYNVTDALFNFSKTSIDWNLDDCDHLIDDWYLDTEEKRYNVHDEENYFVQKYDKALETRENIALKAAHNLLGKVIVKYVDEEGNELISSIEMTGSLGDNYETESKEISNYELVSIPLNSKGIYQKEDITVIYVYQKVSAVFEEQIPPTGENFKLSYPIFALISLIILAGVFILKKRI